MEEGLLLRALSASWWAIFLRAICSLLFGIACFTWPAASLLTLVIFFGAYVLADGVLSVIAGLRNRGPVGRIWLVVSGIAGIIAGVLVLLMPELTAVLLALCVATWSIMIGLLEIFGAVSLRKEIFNEWMLVIAGVLSIAFGIFLFRSPAAGTLTLLYFIGFTAFLRGMVLLALSLRLRSHFRHRHHPA